MGSVLAENAFNTVFLSNTPHIVVLYILPHMGSSPYGTGKWNLLIFGKYKKGNLK